jgi:hypothetical protein
VTARVAAAVVLGIMVVQALVLALEIGVGALVRDNLTLNVLNFVHRFPAIEAWQKGARR